AETIKPSARGEKEITAINQLYLEKGKLQVGVMTRGMTWFDTGTVDSLNDATEFIKVIQNRQSKMIGCIEEVAVEKRFIDLEQLSKLSVKYAKSKYGEYLSDLIKDRS